MSDFGQMYILADDHLRSISAKIAADERIPKDNVDAILEHFVYLASTDYPDCWFTEEQAKRTVSAMGYDPSMVGVYLNMAENDLRRRVLKLLPRGGKVVDVGAHAGFWALPAARRLGPKGRVLAIEPNPWAIQILHRNIRLNGRNSQLSPIVVVPEAVSSEEARRELVAYDLIANASQASFYPPSLNGKPLQKVSVPVRRLDDLDCGPIDLLKIDVEGCEALRELAWIPTGPC